MTVMLEEDVTTYMTICYCLDAFLMLYCIIFTVVFFREKFKNVMKAEEPEKNGIYQELERPKDADPYQVLEQTKKKKKDAKKKKPESNQQQQGDRDLYESLEVSASPAKPPAK